MTALLALLLMITLAAVPNRAAAQEYDGVRSPEELLSYIVGLSSRKFDDLALEQVQIFQTRYPKHALSKEVAELGILSRSRLRQPRETIDAIEKYLNEWPDSPQRESYRQFVGEAYMSLNDYAAARKNYEELLNSKSTSVRENAECQLAVCLSELGEAAKANELFLALAAKSLKEDRPARLFAKHYLALQKQKDGDLDGAMSDYLALLELPFLPGERREALLLTAAQLAFDNFHDYQQAAELYGKFSAEYPDAPQLQAVRRCLVDCQFQLRNYQLVLQLSQDYRQRFAKDAQEDTSLTWMTAQAAVACGNEADAARWLTALLADAKTPASMRQRAERQLIGYYANTQNYPEVLTRTQEYLERYPNALDKADVAQLAGTAAELSDSPETAIRYFRQAMIGLSEDPARAQQVGAHLANYYQRLEQWQAAAELWQELANTAPAAEQRQLLYQSARCSLQVKDFNQALATADAVRKNWPGQTDELEIALLAVVKNAAIELSQISTAAAAAAQQAAIAPAPDKARYFQEVAQLELMQKKYEAAAAALAQAIAAAPETDLAARAPLLATQAQLLLFLKEYAAALKLAPELLDAQSAAQTLSDPVLVELANAAENAHNSQLAERLWQWRIDNLALAPQENELTLCRLADLALNAGKMDDAAARLNEVTTSRSNRAAAPLPAAEALLAEHAYLNKQYAAALVHANQALTPSPDELSLRDTARAQWVKAAVLYEYDRDLDNALKFATLVFIRANDPHYAAKAMALAAKICREQGKISHAEELEAELEKMR